LHDNRGSRDTVREIDDEWVIIYNVVVEDTPKWGVYMHDDNEPQVFLGHNRAYEVAKQVRNLLTKIGIKCECYIVRTADDGRFTPDVK
jgi:hypothetical protein